MPKRMRQLNSIQRRDCEKSRIQEKEKRAVGMPGVVKGRDVPDVGVISVV